MDIYYPRCGCISNHGIAGFYLRRQKKAAFYLDLAFLVLTSTLSITDEVRIYDLFSLIISLAGIVCLLISRSLYLNPADSDRSD